jgi:hypothetical protein
MRSAVPTTHCDDILARTTMVSMKRLIAIPLWFYAGWTVGAFIDFLGGYLGLSIGPVLGMVLGTAAAAMVVGDPRRLIWAAGMGRKGPRPGVRSEPV